MSQTLAISALQHHPTPCDRQASLTRLEQACSDAATAGSQLLLVPEASMTGYNIELHERDQHACEANGELRDLIGELARRYSIAVNYGYIERAADGYFNSVQLLDDSGESVSHYRKTHLWGDLDQTLFSAGDSFSPVVELYGWKIGQLICYDVEFPEAVRHLALAGAELVLVSTALMEPWTTVADLIVPARAAESQLFIAYCNYCGNENGTDYVGHSCIADPTGVVLAKAAREPQRLQATLDKASLQTIRQALPYLRDRRPEIY